MISIRMNSSLLRRIKLIDVLKDRMIVKIYTSSCQVIDFNQNVLLDLPRYSGAKYLSSKRYLMSKNRSSYIVDEHGDIVKDLSNI